MFEIQADSSQLSSNYIGVLMETKKVKNLVTLFLLILALVSCTPYKVNSSRAHLFDAIDCEKITGKKDTEGKCLVQRSPSKTNYYPPKEGMIENKAPFYGSNPIFIAEDAKFSIEINEIKPPALTYSEFLAKVKKGSDHTRDFMFRKYGPLSNASIEQNIRDKELWLLTTIKSQNVNDPLEANSKTYVKSTQVKWDSGSHLLVPLDKTEKIVFTHESDASYRVRFQLMEVDALSVKKELAIIRNQSGVLNFLQVGFTTLLDLLNTAVGKEYINSKIDPIISNDAAFQRFLLSIGATVEFVGEVVILREDKEFMTLYDEELFKQNEFYLLDGFRKNKKTQNDKAGHGLRTNTEYIWNSKNEDGKCVRKNDGGLLLIECNGSKKSAPIINTRELEFRSYAPGFINFSVSQIPVKLSQAPASLDSSHVNQYYDYSRLSKFLESINDNIFDFTESCFNVIQSNSQESSNNNAKELCEKSKLSGLSNEYLGLEVAANTADTDKDKYIDKLLKMEMLHEDFNNYQNSIKQYDESGKDLICLEIAKYKSVQDIANPNRSFQNIDLYKFLEGIDDKIKKEPGLQQLYCTNRVKSIIADSPTESTDEKKYTSLITGIRKNKNELAIFIKQKKAEITQRIYKNIQGKCLPNNDKNGISKYDLFKINERKYSCDLFKAIEKKQAKFYEMTQLLQRAND